MSMSVIEVMRRLIDPVKRRLQMVASRAIINLVNDAGKIQLVQASMLATELQDNIERFQEFGFTSVPLPGAQAVVICMGGNRAHPIIVAVDDPKYRKLGLQGGETAIYNSHGDYILLKKTGEIQIVCSTKVSVTTPLAEFSSNVTIDGNLLVDGNIVTVGSVLAPGGVSASATPPVPGELTDGVGEMSGLRTIYNSHTHVENNIPGSTNVPTQLM